MWAYRYSDELYHYGIPGMKWGHRKITRLEAQRNKLANNKQMGTNKYVKVSNKLYQAKQKQKLKEAKKNKDTVAIENIKYKMREAKLGEKYGANYLNGNQFKSIYGVSSKTKEGQAISIKSNKSAYNKDRTNTALKTLGGVGVTALLTAPAWYPKVEKGLNFIKNVDPKSIKYDWLTGTITGIRR